MRWSESGMGEGRETQSERAEGERVGKSWGGGKEKYEEEKEKRRGRRYKDSTTHNQDFVKKK